jgi:hypothetical protein
MLSIIDVSVSIGVYPPFDWPDPSELEDDSGLGGNRGFFYMGQPRWSDCLDVITSECELVAELQKAKDTDAVLDDDNRDVEFAEILGGLDPGVSSAVNCLAAAGCIPFASCNGGVFGGSHHEVHPLICFYCKDHHVPPLVRAAERSGIGLETQENYVVAYTGDVRRLLQFAREVHAQRANFPKQVDNDALW